MEMGPTVIPFLTLENVSGHEIHRRLRAVN